MKRVIHESFIKELEEGLASLIELYYHFSLIEEPSEQQSDQLFAILDLALYDQQLAEAIEKVDLQIAEELEIRDKLSFYEELRQLQSLAPSIELSVETAFIPPEKLGSIDDH
ncbi:MAG: hypothetical protein PUP91_06955 [Rhizonema sp. PD37]|nr:hypothetical protein [Rhizonema sp. PD37]